MTQVPPDRYIEQARLQALLSPCAKSKRGVVIFGPGRRMTPVYPGSRVDTVGHQVNYATGHNGPPGSMQCDGSNACRRDCAKICVHAERRAIDELLRDIGEDDEPSELVMLHVKVVDGVVVPGGPPSCWQCSRDVLEARLAGFWLFELGRHHPAGQNPPDWRFYTAEEFHLATLKNCGLHIAR